MVTSSICEFEISESGDSALRVVVSGGTAQAQWESIHVLSQRLDAQDIAGLHATVPTYDSVLIEFDPVLISSANLTSLINIVASQLPAINSTQSKPRHFRVPVVYGGEFGPDLEQVALQQGMSPSEIIALHTEKIYTVRCMGAPAGSPMMDGPDFPLPVPRLKDPRLSVPAGAIAVAGRQAVIAPAQAPGGWCLVGRTPLSLLDLGNDPLVPYAPGDTLQFFALAPEEFENYVGLPLRPVPFLVSGRQLAS